MALILEQQRYDQIETCEIGVEERILDVICGNKVVTDREIKVRLENEFVPWVVERAIIRLIKTTNVKKVKLPGRKSISTGKTGQFYCLTDTKYDDIIETIREKQAVTLSVNSALTGTSPAADHAEELFLQAFRALDFKIYGRNRSEYGGRRANGISGKEPPNLDLIVERDGLVYGVDVKNWIRFEANSKIDIYQKANIALELQIIPFMLVRYCDNETSHLLQKDDFGLGMTYRYQNLLLPPSLESLGRRASELLGYPTLISDELPLDKLRAIEAMHENRAKEVQMIIN